jgi:toxin ParE1/3/4
VARRIVLRPGARADLKSIFDWVEQAAGPEQALTYVERIRAHYLALVDFPKRGTDRSDLVPGLRTLAFERRATIAYTVEKDAVIVLRILHKGRDLGRALQD